MKRLLVVCTFLFSCLVASVFNFELVNAGTQDFIISDFTADYYLGKDSEGRSTLKTVESITAVFPEYDQNHGIERFLPTSYDKHKVSLYVQSVKDNFGKDINYYEYNDRNKNRVIRIGDVDTYVHGSNTYVITYSQRDVTKYFKDDDEFYWDVNGDGWSQEFLKVSANIHLDKSLVSVMNGQIACYNGGHSRDQKCVITKNETGDTISILYNDIYFGQTATFAIGFSPNTFNTYKLTTNDYFFKYINLIFIAFGLVLVGIYIYCLVDVFRGGRKKITIIPQYLPPKYINIIQASLVYGSLKQWVSAMLVDLAVRHNIKIIKEVDKNNYSIELVSARNLSKDELEVLKLFFGYQLKPASKYQMSNSSSDIALRKSLSKIIDTVRIKLQLDGYIKEKNKGYSRLAVLPFVIMCLPGFLSGLFAQKDLTILPQLPAYFFIIGIGCILLTVAFLTISNKMPLTESGQELANYLDGLEMYIKLAEIDRIKYLQTPKGAEKTIVDTNNKQEVFHLYERVLPYAILFGLEKIWSATLGEYSQYVESSAMMPNYYDWTSDFSSSNSSLSTPYSDPSDSYSSSGGSSGGGSSGGGGGGGGGGGW